MYHTEIKELIHAKQLRDDGKIKEAFQVVLELEKKDDISPQELLSCKLLKVKLLFWLGNSSDALKCAEDIYQESQKQGDLLSSFDALTLQTHNLITTGNISQSEEIIRHAEDLFKLIKEIFTIDLRERESFLVRIKGVIYLWKGEIQHSLELNKKAYELSKDTNNNELISISLNNISGIYQSMKEYDKAEKYAKKALQVNYKPFLSTILGNLVGIYVHKRDIDEAKVYLEQLRQLAEIVDIKRSRNHYRFCRALVLKSSLRARDRIEAEDILKELAMDKTMPGFTRFDAIIYLCDLFLIELRITNDSKIIDEVQPYIQELLDFVEHKRMYYHLAQTYLLQAKLFLLTGDLKKTKRFLTQAQQIAERFGHIELAEKIVIEQSRLLKQSDLWEKLKETGAPMEERIKMARLNEQIEEIAEKRGISPTFITEEKVAISKETKICLVCRGEVLKFSYICECGAIYCDNCARALSNLENVCWVCNVKIDPLKSIKPYTEESEEFLINNSKKGEKTE